MGPWRLRALWAAWWICLVPGLAAGAVFVHGVLRDTRAGEPVLALDLAAASDWTAVPFRVWGGGPRALRLDSVNHAPAFVGAALTAQFEVAVVDPRGQARFRRVYDGAATGHVLPDNYGGVRLETLVLDDRPWRRWTLRARVLRPDLRFRTARTQLKLWKDRPDLGMGGLVSYAMLAPAGIFLGLALLAALALAGRGRRLPLWVMAGFAAVALALSGLWRA